MLPESQPMAESYAASVHAMGDGSSARLALALSIEAGKGCTRRGARERPRNLAPLDDLMSSTNKTRVVETRCRL
jgi:hypothetical protein